jgi:hypothetical protein
LASGIALPCHHASTKAKIQVLKGSAMYADVKNKRRKDPCAKNVIG